MLRTSAVALAAVCFSGAAFAQLTAQSTPDEVMLRIQTDGARKVLGDLWAREAVFDSLLNHVDRGETRWFKPWHELRAHSDAGASESIDMAFARAIPRAPVAVLRLIGHQLQIENTCTSPFIEPDPGVAEAYERRALRALSSVKDPELKVLAKSCAERVKLPQEHR